MTKRTRLFVLTASAFLLVGVATAGVASYVGLAGLNALGAADELSYVPRDAQFVAAVDVRHLLDSELGKKLLASANGGPVPPELLAETGINVYTDVDSVLIAATADSFSTSNSAPLFLVRGRFDEARLETAAVNKGGVREQHFGVRTVMSEQFGLAFVEQGLIAAGSPASVKLALETGLNGGASIEGHDEAMRLVKRVDGGDTWVVSRFEALQGSNRLPREVAQYLPAITWFAASGQVDSGIAARIHAEARDEQAAKDLQDVVRGLFALVKMQAGQQQGLSDVINSLELSGDGNTVSLGFSVPAQTLDALMKSATGRVPASYPLPALPAALPRVIAASPAI
jgi:hypothetical protein